MTLDLRAVYEAEADAVLSFLSRFGLRGADLEDTLHDTFVTALAREASYDRSRPIRPWLLGIAFRMAVARVRQVRDQTSDIPEQADPAQDPERAVAARQAQVLVQKALAELSEAQGTVFVMHDLEGATAVAIAEVMGVPLATTYSRLRLARQAFAVAVKRLTRPGGSREEGAA